MIIIVPIMVGIEIEIGIGIAIIARWCVEVNKGCIERSWVDAVGTVE